MKLQKIISGGQTGADFAALLVGKHFGIETGGWMPRGFLNHTGHHPEYAELFGMRQHQEKGYRPRTYDNARDSDATLRLAGNFTTAGERCTLNAIKHHKKPHCDVDLTDPGVLTKGIQKAVTFLDKHSVRVLNVAGNSDDSYKNAQSESATFLILLLRALDRT